MNEQYLCRIGSSLVPPELCTACSLYQDFSLPSPRREVLQGLLAREPPQASCTPSSPGGDCESSLPRYSSSGLETDHTLLAYKNSPHPPSTKPSCGPTLSSNSALGGDAKSHSTDEGADSSKTSSSPGLRTQGPVVTVMAVVSIPTSLQVGLFRTNGWSQQPFPMGLGSLLPDLEPTQAHLSDL